MIRTPRLTLSPYVPEDADALVRNVNCPDVARMIESVALPFTKAEALARIENRICTPTRFTFAIRLGDDMIGEIAAGAYDETATPRLGYHLRKEHWGNGFASEIVPPALDHAFRTLGWSKIDADAFDDNLASIHILKKIGFVRIGASTCSSQARDDEMTTSIFRMTRPHWATPELKTARLTMRPYRATDVERLHILLNNLEVSRMLSPVAFPYTQPLAEEWISGALWNARDIHFAINNGEGLIGATSLNYSDSGSPMTGFWLGQPYWGKGYMTEAFKTTIDWAFSEHGDAQIVSNAFVDNIGSQRIHEKAGFIAGKTVSHHSKARGEPVNAITYTLARSDWQARQ